MKKILTGTIAALLFSLSAWAAGVEKTVHVNGMVCAFCAQGIEKKFKGQSAVEGIDVSLEKHLVKLKLKEGQNLTDTEITKLLKDAGYTVTKIE